MRRTTAWALVGCLALGSAAGARAEADAALSVDTAPTLHELAQLGRSLGHPDGAVRSAAYAQLRTLTADALPAIKTRLTEVAKRDFDHQAVLLAMSEFRSVQGVVAPDGPVDLAQGVLRVLERERSASSVLAGELIALLRALEAQKTPEAAELIVGRLFSLDAKLFRYEAPRTQERLGALLIPALIRHQSSSKPWLAAYCQASLEAMGVVSPGRAVQQDDVVLLSAILTAYGDTLTFEAMPVVVAYVTDERREVRSAARKALARFGRNAIWQVRERYLNATGKEADASWSYQRIVDELYRLHDGPKQQAFEAAIARAEAAIERGEGATAREVLGQAMVSDPGPDEARRAAPLYARLAEQAFAREELLDALELSRRALRLDPGAPAAPALQARIAYLEAELRLAQGVVDMTGYRRAAALDPELEAAQQALDELSGARSARETHARRLLGLGAALLMALGGFFMLRRTREEEPVGSDDAGDCVAASEPVAPS